MKQALGEYLICALLGVSGLKLAYLVEWMPTPAEAGKAFFIGLISAAAGLLLRFVWGKIQQRFNL